MEKNRCKIHGAFPVLSLPHPAVFHAQPSDDSWTNQKIKLIKHPFLSSLLFFTPPNTSAIWGFTKLPSYFGKKTSKLKKLVPQSQLSTASDLWILPSGRPQPFPAEPQTWTKCLTPSTRWSEPWRIRRILFSFVLTLRFPFIVSFFSWDASLLFLCGIDLRAPSQVGQVNYHWVTPRPCAFILKLSPASQAHDFGFNPWCYGKDEGRKRGSERRRQEGQKEEENGDIQGRKKAERRRKEGGRKGKKFSLLLILAPWPNLVKS